MPWAFPGNSRSFSSVSSSINSWFITGFTDGDGSFSYSIFKKQRSTLGWQVVLMFTIEILNTPDNVLLLQQFQFLFNGHISYRQRLVRFRVTKLNDLVKVRSFFLTYPLQTSKIISFNTWCQILDIMLAGSH